MVRGALYYYTSGHPGREKRRPRDNFWRQRPNEALPRGATTVRVAPWRWHDLVKRLLPQIVVNELTRRRAPRTGK